MPSDDEPDYMIKVKNNQSTFRFDFFLFVPFGTVRVGLFGLK